MRLPLIFCLFISLLVCAGCGTRDADDLASVHAAKVLRIGVKADTPPYGLMRGGARQGFDVDLAMAVASRLGVEPAFVTVTSADRIPKLLAGEVDCVIASMTITRTREQQVDFSVPYFQDGQALLVRSASPVQSYQDLAGKKVAFVKGSTSGTYLKQVAPEAIGIEVDDFTSLLATLDNGQTDAVTSDLLILIGLRKSAQNAADLRLAGSRFTTEPYGIAVRQNQSELRDALNLTLMEMWEDGSWRQIADTWFGPGAPYEHRITFAMPVVPK
jgi:polar amino acid transport system substrate-binding protein